MCVCVCVHNCGKLVNKTEELVFVNLDSSGLYHILFSFHSDGEMSYYPSLKSLHHSPRTPQKEIHLLKGGLAAKPILTSVS